VRQGKPNKIIAHELKISKTAVKIFVRRIMMKLGHPTVPSGNSAPWSD
jgi:DNA-binding NarL/FixJ family response regulator